MAVSERIIIHAKGANALVYCPEIHIRYFFQPYIRIKIQANAEPFNSALFEFLSQDNGNEAY